MIACVMQLFGMSVSIIKISDNKPHPPFIGGESLSIRILLAKTFKGIPALMTVTCKDTQV